MPVILTSACLLGQQVRYDGGHKRNRYLETLAAYMELRPICPEVGIGLGVPRPPIHLVQHDSQVRLLEVRDHSRDFTDKMTDFARAQLNEHDSVDGFIAKKDSPSCGMARVRVHDGERQLIHKRGVGMFTGVWQALRPELPVEEEGRLNDLILRENFLQRVFVHCRWRKLREEGLTTARLIEFHTRHKYMVMAHSISAYQRLGRLLSQAGKRPLEALAKGYFLRLMAALQRRARRPNHVNALQHLSGYLRKYLSSQDRQELVRAIEDYRRGEVPLIVPFTLLRHHQSHIRDLYLAGQYYLEPYPPALGLRNGI
ncbi:MAG: DUF523 and DUF1722 domain-containing protein [Methylohalobius crimeensis]